MFCGFKAYKNRNWNVQTYRTAFSFFLFPSLKGCHQTLLELSLVLYYLLYRHLLLGVLVAIHKILPISNVKCQNINELAIGIS